MQRAQRLLPIQSSPYTVNKTRYVEIDKKAHVFLCKFEICHKLVLVDWHNLINCFEFYDNLIFNQEIYHKKLLSKISFIIQWQAYLLLHF